MVTGNGANHVTDEYIEKMKKMVMEGPFEYFKGQIEKGNGTGHEHLQAIVRLKDPKTFAQVKAMFEEDGNGGLHLEPAKCPKKGVEYCGKQDTRVRGPWEFGNSGNQGKRSDLEQCTKEVIAGRKMKKVALDHGRAWVQNYKGLEALRALVHEPRARFGILEVVLLVGETGVGKTRLATSITSPENLYTVMDPKAPWFNGYVDQKVVIFDDMGIGDIMNINILKRVLDGYACQVPIKGGHVPFNPHLIIVTSNHQVEDWYPGGRATDINAIKRRFHHTFNLPEDNQKCNEWFFKKRLCPHIRETPEDGGEREVIQVVSTSDEESDVESTGSSCRGRAGGAAPSAAATIPMDLVSEGEAAEEDALAMRALGNWVERVEAEATQVDPLPLQRNGGWGASA